MRRLHAVLARPRSLDVVLRFSNSFILSEHPTYILLFTLIERRYAATRAPRRNTPNACVSFHLPPPLATSLHLHSPLVSSMFGFLLGHDFQLECRRTLSHAKTEPQELNFRVADHSPGNAKRRCPRGNRDFQRLLGNDCALLSSCG
jgi:hypothetical protein